MITMITATTFFNHPNVKGVIEFEEKGGKVLIKGTLKSTRINAVLFSKDVFCSVLIIGGLRRGKITQNIHLLKHKV